jgi:superfamily II DNA or RNA helicase
VKLRGYQQEALSAIRQGFETRQRLLAVLPTGAGKTILFAHLAASVPGRTLVLAHREELLTQAADKIERATGLVAEIEKADQRASMSAPVVVASVQTMIGRASRWPVDHFSLVVVDEAHHALADSYQGILSRFHGHAKVLGVTATPDRGDKRNLGKYFEEIAYEVGLTRLIKDGYLSRIVVKRLPVGIDLRDVKRTAGDYSAQGVGDAIEPKLSHVADAIAGEAWDRKTIVFLPLVKTARDFAEMLRARRLDARAVAGEDKPDHRAGVLDWFAKSGSGSVLCNAMLLTEGFDQPDVDCVVCLRPTQVRALFVQMVGRGTRVHPGKNNLLLLDFLWQTEDHQLVSAARLVSGHDEDVATVEKLVETAGDEEIDLVEAAEDAEESRIEKLKERLKEVRKKTPGTWDLLELAFALNEEELLSYEPSMEWHEKEVTPAQAQALIKAGFDPLSITCRGHASKILDTLARRRSNELATVKQVRLLRRFGHPNPSSASFREAGAWLDKQFQRTA